MQGPATLLSLALTAKKCKFEAVALTAKKCKFEAIAIDTLCETCLRSNHMHVETGATLFDSPALCRAYTIMPESTSIATVCWDMCALHPVTTTVPLRMAQ